MTIEEIEHGVMENGKCPECGATFTDPVDPDTGKPIPNPPNKVLIHGNSCTAFVAQKF